MKNYDAIMQNMTLPVMAELRVKLVTVNNRDLYYLTSSGQLFLTSEYEAAVQHELSWLNYDPTPAQPATSEETNTFEKQLKAEAKAANN